MNQIVKNGLLCQIQSHHLNIFLRKFRKPMTRAKGHVSVITKIVSARELRYERGRSSIEYPHSPDQKSASINHDMNLMYIICSCSGLLGSHYYVARTHKNRLTSKNWNTSSHFCFETCFKYAPLEKVIAYEHYSNY